MFKSIIKKFGNAKKFAKANLLCRERDYGNAYTELKAIDLTYAKVERKIEYYALRGFVAALNKNFGDVENCYMQVLSTSKEDNSFTESELNYITAYAALYYKELVDLGRIQQASFNSFAIPLKDINLNDVRGRLKKLFPLREHPDWC